MLGLKDSTPEQGCPHHLVKAADRHDMTKPVSYDEGDMTCSLQKMQSGELQPGQKHKPLLNIPLGRVIIDEFQLLLRVTDVLERNVVLEVVEWDAAEGVTSLSKGPHLKSFLKVVKCLGLTFTV